MNNTEIFYSVMCCSRKVQIESMEGVEAELKQNRYLNADILVTDILHYWKVNAQKNTQHVSIYCMK